MMASKEYDIWLDKFNREIGYKSAVILHGNTTDIICNRFAGNKYTPLVECVTNCLAAKGYAGNIILWDRVSGLNPDSASIAAPVPAAAAGGDEYDLGGDFPQENSSGIGSLQNPEDFLQRMLAVIQQEKTRRIAFVLNYSDFLFGSARSLSEREQQYITSISKAIQSSQTYNLGEFFNSPGHLVIFITRDNATIPPAVYIGNPLASVINVPLPGRNERERFVTSNLTCLNVALPVSGGQNKARLDDFIDGLDGFSLKEIAQMMKLSRQLSPEILSCDKLVNLFKYGEKISPWEELSKEKLEKTAERLGKRVKGQDAAIQKVREVIIRAYTGFAGLQHSAKQKKPKGTLFFVGPTGVGKTELAKALAEFVFGDENACIRFDMSEFNHEHSDQRLVGAPPGFVGYEAGGELTNAVKAKPFCVLLFDEIEKAHPKIFDKFLQILEDGRLTDGKGETVYFSETIIIFTSNIGAAEAMQWLSEKQTDTSIAKSFIESVRKHFITELKRPELLNRIGDNIVAFNFITAPDVFAQIALVKFRPIQEFVKEKYKANLEFADESAAISFIAECTDKSNGGRGLLNTLENKLINPLAEFIFDNGESLSGATIRINLLRHPKFPRLSSFDFEIAPV